jgi:hypothetical protein
LVDGKQAAKGHAFAHWCVVASAGALPFLWSRTVVSWLEWR